MIVLAIGDVVGEPGMSLLRKSLWGLRKLKGADLVIANGENATGGKGLSPEDADELFAAGVDVITSGNHIWQRRDLYDRLDDDSRILRPANYPAGSPGSGAVAVEAASGDRVLVANLMGLVFMDALDCPFREADRILARHEDVRVRIFDFHAEATSEKLAMAAHLDGRASLLFGTHTHVQTADECIFSGGLGYITDLGMTGPGESILGVKREGALRRFLTRLPTRLEVADGPAEIHGLLAEIDPVSGKATAVERLALR